VSLPALSRAGMVSARAICRTVESVAEVVEGTARFGRTARGAGLLGAGPVLWGAIRVVLVSWVLAVTESLDAEARLALSIGGGCLKRSNTPI
jgi:hypothetical protein